MGKYYYPYGVEYGEDEYFPPSLLNKCTQTLEEVKVKIDQFALK